MTVAGARYVTADGEPIDPSLLESGEYRLAEIQPDAPSTSAMAMTATTGVAHHVSADTPVFNGPVFNLESYDNLPEPVESHQRLEPIEGDEGIDSNGNKKYKLVTTHILPPVTVYAPPANPVKLRPIRERAGRTQWSHNLGELILDTTAPDGLAIKLLLLEAKAPFIVHEVDLAQDNVRSAGNPHGKVPCWLDYDGSCVWEANAIMRYVCDKYDLDPRFYFHDSDSLKCRVDMALDWCHTALAIHIGHVMDPELHEQDDLSDLPGGRIALEKDYKVLTDYFLRETPFVGGDEPDIADFTICMHLLLLFATAHPPPDRVRQYLHNTAEHVYHWNDVTLPIREFCMRRQLDLRQADADMDRYRYEEDLARRAEGQLHLQQEDDGRRQQEEYNAKASWEAKQRKMEEEERKRREEQDRRMKEEWERSRQASAEKLAGDEASRLAALEAEQRRVEEERRKREAEEAAWQAEYEERMAKMREWEASRAATVVQPPTENLRPQVGVEIKLLDDSRGNPDCVVAVETVLPDGPADKAGILCEDVIDMWNGDRLFSKANWAEKVKGSKIGEVVNLKVFREGEPMDIKLTIGGTSKALGRTRTVHSSGQVQHNIRYRKPSVKA